MSKYSNKIISFLGNSQPQISINSSILSNNAIKQIYNCILSSITIPHNYVKIESYIINAIHDRNQYPFMYILFSNLKQHGLLNELFDSVPDVTNFKVFLEWYRINNGLIDLNLLHNKIIKYNNKKIVELYNLMFGISGIRERLHNTIYKNKFISIDIQHDMETSDIVFSKYLIDGEHDLYLFVPNGHDPPNINLICIIFDIMKNIAIRYNLDVPKIDLTVLYSNQKKKIPHNTKILCSDNINSGSTYSGKSIVCWRKEEFYKVLIHELFHYYRFDFSSHDPYYPELEHMINTNINIDGVDMLNESYTETIAIIINSLLISVINFDNNDVAINILSILKTELSFIMYQVAKIICVFGGTSINDIINNKIIIKQTTSVRSYFIIKMFLLSNLDGFLELINHDMVLQDKQLITFGNLIRESINKFDKKNLDLIDNFISRYKSSNDKNRWIFKTGRMSVNSLLV